MARFPQLHPAIAVGSVIMGTVISAVAGRAVSGNTLAGSDGRQIDSENTGYSSRSATSSEVLKTKHSSTTEGLDSRQVETIPGLKFVSKV